MRERAPCESDALLTDSVVLPANPHPPGHKAEIRCTSINDDDVEAVIGLLTRGFPDRSEPYWRRGIERHLGNPVPDGCPRLGFVLKSQGRPVGVLLALYSSAERNGRAFVRCNLSSWYVEPPFRTYAALLDKVAMRRKDTTYTNISADPRTWPIHEARGFRRFCTGVVVGMPLLSAPRPAVRLQTAADEAALGTLSEGERRILRDHAGYGCVCLVGTDTSGSEPFVFVRRPVDALRRRLARSPVSYFHLVYCRSTAAVPRFAHALGRYLVRHFATPWIAVDATGPIPGLKGRFLEGRGTKFALGPNPIEPGDLAYSELVLFGP